MGAAIHHGRRYPAICEPDGPRWPNDSGASRVTRVLLISLKTNDYSFRTYDWLALIIKAVITGIGISLYKPIVLIVSSHVAAFVQSGRKPNWHPYCANFVAFARNLTLLVLLGVCGSILVPKLSSSMPRSYTLSG